MDDPLDRVADPLAAIERGLGSILGAPKPKPNRAQRRAGHIGDGPGEGKHPLGATKPLRAEAAAKRRRRRRSR